MTPLLLVGITQDRERLEKLLAGLQRLDPDLTISLRLFGADLAGDSGAEAQDGKAGSQNIICWTETSAGDAGARLIAHAILLKEGNAYLGLLLDDVAVPEVVQTAQDISIAGWDGNADRSLLEAVLESVRSSTNERQHPTEGGWTVVALWQQFIDILVRIERRVARVQNIALLGVGLTITTFIASLVFNYDNSADKLCRVSLIQPICHKMDWGNLPTDEQEKAFRSASAGAECKPFADYLNRYGPGAPYADEVKQRLDLSQDVDRPFNRKPLQLNLSIPLSSMAGQPSERAALSVLTEQAENEAREFCKQQSQAFAGEYAPGRYLISGQPMCVNNGDGIVCGARGFAVCSFIEMQPVKVCKR